MPLVHVCVMCARVASFRAPRVSPTRLALAACPRARSIGYTFGYGGYGGYATNSMCGSQTG